jgi:Ribonuclease G/E
VTDNTAHEPNTPTEEEADRPARARTRTRTARTRSSTRARDEQDASASGDAPQPEQGAGSSRARSRRGGDKSAEDRPSDSETGTQDDGSRDSDDGGKRRRRRGRRGRGGRGRGGGGSSNASKQDAQTESDADTGASQADAKDAEAKGKGGSSAGGSGRSGSGRSGSGRSGSGRSGSGRSGSAKGNGSGKGGAKSKGGSDKKGGGSDKGDGATSDADREMQQAIEKGGTRAAAKRGRQGGAGRGGGRRGQRPGGVPEEVRRAILEGPPRTMLVTSREDRTQIAVLEDRSVVEHYVTRTDDVTLVGNIYMARVQNVLPGMEAAFLDIGKGRNGVLYAGEVLYDELDLEEGADERIENALKSGQKVLVQVTKDPMGSKGPRLTMHLSLAGRFMVLAPNSDLFGISRKLTDKERDRLRRVVKQVKPDHHGVIVRTAAEGATEEQITADLERLLAKWARVEERAEDAKALTAVYEEPPLVVKVIRDNFGPEFERCIVDSEELYHQVREYLGEVAPELLDKVELYGAPTADARARAAGAPASAAALQADAEAARAASATGTGDATDAVGDATAKAEAAGPGDDAPGEAPGDDGAGKASSDDTAGETAGDAEASDGDAPSPVEDAAVQTVPDATPEIEGGGNEVDLAAAAERRKELPPLFVAYDVTEQLRKATSRKVWLPSGGYLIIETTEAMKVIDVNTGKFTGGKDTNLEEVVLKTNLEAADEIVRQLRLRDMGGIIIIDFIDMLLKANQEQVVRRLKRELLRDRTKTRVSDVSQLGLVQMTRKNVSQGLLESFSTSCEHCDGRGVISELD